MQRSPGPRSTRSSTTHPHRASRPTSWRPRCANARRFWQPPDDVLANRFVMQRRALADVEPAERFEWTAKRCHRRALREIRDLAGRQPEHDQILRDESGADACAEIDRKAKIWRVC